MVTGDTVGPYTILTKSGEGGMGAVYRARDTKLNRDVALKVLLPDVAGDAERLARFRREAQTLAALNHPHIGGIYGLEESGGTIALVLELVEGPTLADRIAQGAVPIDEALPVAKQIAEALEAAHEQGIIHRDLKPANIKVRGDGTVKVLDFGLAKALQDPRTPGPQDLSNSPTFTSPAMTRAGVILGTAAYMAPEQAKGRPVDRRADIWSFGVVLYEMLTGRRAFTGNDASELLASVLRDTPDFSVLPAATPPSVRRLLRRSLEKDPKKRLSAIGDARLELDEVHAELPVAAAAGPASRLSAAFALTAALAFAGIAAIAAWYLKPSATLPLRVLELPGAVVTSSQVALSPDGTRIAYILEGHLRVRALDAVLERDLGPVRSTASPGGAASFLPVAVFWSPDSATVGFTSEHEIRSVPADGGPVFAVGRIPATGEAIAARWLLDGAIVFAVWRESVYSVPAAGGAPVVALALDPATEIDVHHLSEGPDGSLIAQVHQRSDRYFTVLAPRGTGAGATRIVLTDDQTIGQIDYVAPGFVVFDRQKTNSGVWVAPYTGGPIDPTRASLLQAGATDADVATDGSAIFVMPAASRVTPVWVDRTGNMSGAIGSPVTWSRMGFALSPDGGRVAVVTGQDSGGSDAALIVRDLATGADTRLTARADEGPNAPPPLFLNAPSWFPSGDRLLLSAGGTEAGNLVAQSPNEATAPREFAANFVFGRLSRDGRALAAVRDERGRHFLMSAPVSADGVVGEARRVRPDDDALVDDVDVSPGGRLVVSEVRRASGGPGIFLSEFPIGKGQWQVAEEGTRPRFSPDGREIFYLESTAGAGGQVERRLMSRTVNTMPSIALGPAAVLFGGEAAAMLGDSGYEVDRDGRRFLAMKSVAPGPGEGKRFIWMQNWPAVLKRSSRSR